MVVAREHFLGRGHYQLLSMTIAVLAAEHDPGADGVVVDLAGSTGHYQSAVRPHRHGLCVDGPHRRSAELLVFTCGLRRSAPIPASKIAWPRRSKVSSVSPIRR
jgi:hypothetical protein